MHNYPRQALSSEDCSCDLVYRAIDQGRQSKPLRTTQDELVKTIRFCNHFLDEESVMDVHTGKQQQIGSHSAWIKITKHRNNYSLTCRRTCLLDSFEHIYKQSFLNHTNQCQHFLDILFENNVYISCAYIIINDDAVGVIFQGKNIFYFRIITILQSQYKNST